MNKVKIYATHAARILLGLVFFGAGLVFFIKGMPKSDTPPPENVMKFMGGLMATGYLFPLIKATEVVSGALLLANRFNALALVLLAPIVVNIVGFHTFVGKPEPLPYIVLALEIGLAWAYRDAYRGVLAAKVGPPLLPTKG